MNDKQQLAAMGAQYRLTEEQAKLLAERMPQSGVLQILDVEPLCMAKRIEELEAQLEKLTNRLAWRNTGSPNGLRRFMTQKQYKAQTPGVQKWYEPIRYEVPEGCAMLYVGSGMFAKCDWEDWPRVMGYWWRLSTEREPTRYAQAHDSHDTLKRKRVAMHRLILSARDGDVVDHINGDGLDNRRSNLRIVTIQQNAFNQKHHGGSSRHKGVSYRADSGTWRAYITKDGKRRYLGTFASEDDAARAYNNEAERLFGEHAKLNAAAPSPDSAK